MLFSICILGLLILLDCEAYMLLQLRRQDANHSNVDALIHKVVPSDKFDKFAKRMDEVQREAEERSNNRVNRATEEVPEQKMAEETPEQQQSQEPTLMDIITLVGRKLRRGPSGHRFRSNSDVYEFKPNTVKLNAGASSVYNVHPQTVESAFKDLLTSITVGKYLDKLSRKAAVVYNTVKQDLQPLAISLLRKYPINTKIAWKARDKKDKEDKEV